MPSTDFISLIVIHIVLFLLIILSIRARIRASWRRRHGASKLSVTRGEEGMNALHVWYGITTVAYSLAVSVSTFAEGHKTTLIVLDYTCLTYLFFFDAWFRDSIALKWSRRIKTD